MSEPAWFRAVDLTRANVAVVVLWAGRTFRCVYIDKPGVRRGWAAREKGELVYLPRRIDALVWGPEPDGWRPVDPGAWPDPLPVPLRGSAPRMGRIGGVAFSATEAAAEMEADRETARAQARRADAAERATLPWWRDTTQMSYAAAGQAITAREAEGRVMRALYFMAGEFEYHFGQQPRAPLNADRLEQLRRVANLGSGDGVDATRIPRMLEAPSDTPDRLLAAMRWATELSLQPGGSLLFDVLDARARNRPLTFAEIAALPGKRLSKSGAHSAYARAIARVTAIANTGTPIANQFLHATQERNRRHANAR